MDCGHALERSTSKCACENGDGDGVNQSQDGEWANSKQKPEDLVIGRSKTTGTHFDNMEKHSAYATQEGLAILTSKPRATGFAVWTSKPRSGKLMDT